MIILWIDIRKQSIQLGTVCQFIFSYKFKFVPYINRNHRLCRFIIQRMNKSYLVTILLAAIAAVALYNQQTDAAPYSFDQFKADYQKSYLRAGEEEYRKTIFLRNLVKIAEHNANKGNTYEIGINQFTDLTNAEFQALYLTLRVPVKNEKIYVDTVSPNVDLDWQAKGAVTAVKNQGQCGSCWAFSATASLESAYLIQKGQTTNLSEQQLVDCSRSYGNQGCNGGWMDSAFDYILAGGITSTTAYPYVARDQACAIKGGAWKLTDYKDVPGCDQLLNALSSRPVSVAVDASVWSPYRSGVLSNCGTSVNHGVLLTGATDAYWRIKNSWGSSWGESGFIRISRGNTCAICQYPSYPIV